MRRERELRGIALADIAKITKINLNSLQALEENKLNLLPGEFFIKGMIRAYAKVVGLDEDQVLTLYAHSIQQKVQDQVYETRRRETPILKSRKPNTPLIALAAVFLVAVTLLIILGFAQKKGPQAQDVPARTKGPATAVEAKIPVVPAAAAPAPVQAPAQKQPLAQKQTAPAVEAPAGITLEITFQQATWIEVAADGQPVLGQTKQAGEHVTLTCRKEFVLNTGNAGGFTYTLNGRPGKPLGGPGAVVKNVRINLDNLRDYLGTT